MGCIVTELEGGQSVFVAQSFCKPAQPVTATEGLPLLAPAAQRLLLRLPEVDGPAKERRLLGVKVGRRLLNVVAVSIYHLLLRKDGLGRGRFSGPLARVLRRRHRRVGRGRLLPLEVQQLRRRRVVEGTSHRWRQPTGVSRRDPFLLVVVGLKSKKERLAELAVTYDVMVVVLVGVLIPLLLMGEDLLGLRRVRTLVLLDLAGMGRNAITSVRPCGSGLVARGWCSQVVDRLAVV